ncbi:MAG: hypothetical protein ABWY21_18075 [Rhodococcus sp. (in: high G+C Gram-positive bacteria)]
MESFARWWDGVELWVTGLPFVPQSVVVLAVLVPVAFVSARVFDRVLAVILRVLGRDASAARDAELSASTSTTQDGR